jgi:hypothetical protein
VCWILPPEARSGLHASASGFASPADPNPSQAGFNCLG